MTHPTEPRALIAEWRTSPWAGRYKTAWSLTANAEAAIASRLRELGDDFAIADNIAVHRDATIERGAVLKGPIIIGPRCLVAAGAYLRGGVWLGADCIVGPACEIKTTFMFAGSKIAHLSFVGDSVIGAGVNVEAGAIIANYRNELVDKRIRIATEADVIDTGVEKFGALAGDGVRIGANAVIAPGAILPPDTVVGRLQLVDQYPEAR